MTHRQTEEAPEPLPPSVKTQPGWHAAAFPLRSMRPVDLFGSEAWDWISPIRGFVADGRVIIDIGHLTAIEPDWIVDPDGKCTHRATGKTFDDVDAALAFERSTEQEREPSTTKASPVRWRGFREDLAGSLWRDQSPIETDDSGPNAAMNPTYLITALSTGAFRAGQPVPPPLHTTAREAVPWHKLK
jgi:hypothetical protein